MLQLASRRVTTAGHGPLHAAGVGHEPEVDLLVDVPALQLTATHAQFGTCRRAEVYMDQAFKALVTGMGVHVHPDVLMVSTRGRQPLELFGKVACSRTLPVLNVVAVRSNGNPVVA
jgi:hypothetical protein